MIVGSHAESHSLLSTLSNKKQFLEIKNSKVFLEKIIKKKVDIFSYPYGLKNSYKPNTIRILKKLDFKLGFTAEDREITKWDLSKRSLELPRFDCNQF